jgi:hypothetical protein
VPLVPTKYPHKGDLMARVPAPTFCDRADLQVAVGVARGDSQLAKTLRTELTLATFAAEQLDAVGVVLDADNKSPRDRWCALRRAIELPPRVHVALPVEPNTVAPSDTRFGALVLPGDGTQGNLEDLLLACARVVYPQLLRKARTYLRSVDRRARHTIGDDELSEFDAGSGSGYKKALFGVMAAPLRPGKSMQVSIQDNRWLSESTREVPGVRACLAFMEALLGRPPSSQARR